MREWWAERYLVSTHQVRETSILWTLESRRRGVFLGTGEDSFRWFLSFIRCLFMSPWIGKRIGAYFRGGRTPAAAHDTP